MTKYVTNEQLLGELGTTLIKARLLRMGFTWHPSNSPLEAGIDGWIELRDPQTGEVANVWLAVQSRARSKLERETSESVSYTCNERDYNYWLSGNMPVVLVVSKPRNDEAWWVSIKDYFRNRPKDDRRITFDRVRDAFDATAADRLKALGNASGSGAYLNPSPCDETLISNLLRVTKLPSRIFSASTSYHEGKELNARLKTFVEWPPREWILTKGKILSCHNLHEPPWSEVCEAESVNSRPIEEWANSDNEDARRELVRMLNNCLRAFVGPKGLKHAKDDNIIYFKATHDLKPRKFKYHGGKKKTERVVFGSHQSKLRPDEIAYYRHDAFQYRFRCYGGMWYLEIEPTYIFTKDGNELDPYREERLAKIQSIEGDSAVAGCAIMFSQYLREERSLLGDAYPFLGFGELEEAQIDVGINDKAWSALKSDADNTESDDSSQGVLFQL